MACSSQRGSLLIGRRLFSQRSSGPASSPRSRSRKKREAETETARGRPVLSGDKGNKLGPRGRGGPHPQRFQASSSHVSLAGCAPRRMANNVIKLLECDRVAVLRSTRVEERGLECRQDHQAIRRPSVIRDHLRVQIALRPTSRPVDAMQPSTLHRIPTYRCSIGM